MKYEKYYNNLIYKRQFIDVLNKNECYCETHHIIPYSWGGTNNKENLVNLTAREHYIAHRFLERIAKEKYGEYSDKHIKMLTALFYMLHTDKDGYTKNISSREYEEIKKKYAIANSVKMSGANHWHYGQHWDEETRKKISIAHTGKTMSDDFKKKLSKAMSGENNPMYGKNYQSYGLKRWANEAKGKTFDEIFGEEKSKEIRKNLSNKTSGKNNPMYGKNVKDYMTPEAYNEMLRKRSIAMKGQFLGRKLSEEAKIKIKEKHKGKHWFNNGEKEILVEICPDGFIKGRLLK